MKKTFEFFIVLIIFYGVYSAFDDALLYIFPNLALFTIILISLLVAAGLLLLYSQVIIGSTQHKVTEKMTQVVSDLEQQVREKEEEVRKKDIELHDAFKIKKAVENEVKETL